MICIPHTQKGDWGFRESITANYSPTISNTLLSLSIPWKKKYKEERQTLEMVKAYVDQISSYNDSRLSGDLANTKYLLANVRQMLTNGSVNNSLIRGRFPHSPSLFVNSLQDRSKCKMIWNHRYPII